MKHILSISLLILIPCIISPMNKSYCLPTAQTITQRLSDKGFSNFSQETKMGENLGNENIDPIILWSKISYILTQYKNSYPFIIAAWDGNIQESYPPKVPTQSELMRIVLQDYPEAIKALEQNHWIESNKKTRKILLLEKTTPSFNFCALR